MDIRYPRPQMIRDQYLLLDKNWTLNGIPIHVPYPPESELSGYKGPVPEKLIYKTTFTVPADWREERLLLHFGAVDQICSVFLNGIRVDTHKGGYLPFTIDITAAAKRDTVNKLTVKAMDKLDPAYPYGKQSMKPEGMWYTPVSGIWQMVWLEPVPDRYISSVTQCVNMETLTLKVEVVDKDIDAGHPPASFFYRLVPGESVSGASSVWIKAESGTVTIPIKSLLKEIGCTDELHLWSPDHPYLYHMELRFGSDTVRIYFALRELRAAKTGERPGVYLNNERVYLHGVLDQGYFKDGLFLPGDLHEYEKDILRVKKLGFNMLRKHVKIEPEQFYSACDRLGILVLQDMVNSGIYHRMRETVLPNLGFQKKNDQFGQKQDRKRKTFYVRHCLETVRHLGNHPCIIGWTLFNEGWGQFDSDRLYELVKKEDPGRMIDSTSGWFAQKKSDFDSLHVYFRTKKLKVGKRPLLLSECGGFGMRVRGHQDAKKTLGYGKYCSNGKELAEKYRDMYERMVLPSISAGLCGDVLTQLSDVEGEINGLYTYDRKVCKPDQEMMLDIADALQKALL